jgi:hypothetical protein
MKWKKEKKFKEYLDAASADQYSEDDNIEFVDSYVKNG